MELKALKSRNKPQLVAIVLLTITVVVSFANTLVPAFHCDDFFHTDFLYRAFGDRPGRLLSIFYTPWLNDTSFICFYRPLTELSLALDYLLYQGFAMGYHATNMLLHLANCFIVLQVFKALLSRFLQTDKGTTNFYALLATLIFACLPTHSEAVGWILSRSDLVSTLFYLLTLLCFMQAKSKLQFLTPVFFILALLSKESAVSLPVVLFGLSLSTGTIKSERRHLIVLALITVLYLALRTAVLGTFYGGYAGSLGELMAGGMLERWFSSEVLFQIFHPFNEHLVGSTSPLRLTYRLLYIVFAILIMLCGRLDKALKAKGKMISWLIFFVLMAILPSAQIIGVTSLMSGGRVEYLPSIPAALALTMAISVVRPVAGKWSTLAGVLSLGAALTMIVTNIITVQKNNLSWQYAGAMINSLQSQIKEQTDRLSHGQKLVIFNLNSQLHGAFCFTNDLTFKGLISPPLLTNTQDRVIALDFRPLISPTINLADLKSALARPDKYRVCYFDQTDFKLKQYAPADHAPGTLTFVGDEKVATDQGLVQQYFYAFDGGIAPLDCEVLQIKMQASGAADKVKVFIDYNDRPKDYDDYNACFKLPCDGLLHTIDLPVAAHKSWLLTKTVKTIKLTVTGVDKTTISTPTIAIKRADSICPVIGCKEIGIIKGRWHDGWHLPAISFDVHIEGASSLEFELARANYYFEHYSGAAGDEVPERIVLRRWSIPAGSGQIIDNPILLNALGTSDGIYQLRARALDAKGRPVSSYCQPLTIDCRTLTKNPSF